MTKKLRSWVGAAAGIVAALIMNSCAYDPNYVSTSVGSSYSSGYGPGYGYGGDSFSSSVFVSTGNPRWGYDPGCYSYYDYTRRAYYDPYLNGYYPIGYRPPVVYGVSHPYGWRPGLAYCRPPSRVTNVTITNYSNREASYLRAGYITREQTYARGPAPGFYGGNSYQGRRGYQQPINPYPSQGQTTRSRGYRQNNSQQGSGYPARYNTPATVRQREIARDNPAFQNFFDKSKRNQQPANNQVQPIAPPDRSGEKPQLKEPREQKSFPQRKADLDGGNTRKFFD